MDQRLQEANPLWILFPDCAKWTVKSVRQSFDTSKPSLSMALAFGLATLRQGIWTFFFFEYVDIFSLACDGRPTHQDRFYLPRRPYSARVSSLSRLVGQDQGQRLLFVTTDMYHQFSQICLIPTAELRDDEQNMRLRLPRLHHT
jgi:hypothetical protein